MKKRSTHIPLKEKMTHRLKGHRKKGMRKVALEPEGQTAFYAQ